MCCLVALQVATVSRNQVGCFGCLLEHNGEMLKALQKVMSGLQQQFRNVRIPLQVRPWDFPGEILLRELIKSPMDSCGIIVGAHLGYEVPKLLGTSKVVSLVLFEANPEIARKLEKRMTKYANRVRVMPFAVSSQSGEQLLLETSVDGNGSLLPISQFGSATYGLQPTRAYPVPSTTLDAYLESEGDTVDFLWIDVQGAELEVLRGAIRCLKSVTWIHIEIALEQSSYVDGALFDDLEDFLKMRGFRCFQLNLDMATGQGNALYARVTHLKTFLQNST